MNIKERLKALLEGKKIRMKSWADNSYIKMTENGVLVNSNKGTVHEQLHLFNSDYEWEEFIENHETNDENIINKKIAEKNILHLKGKIDRLRPEFEGVSFEQVIDILNSVVVCLYAINEKEIS